MAGVTACLMPLQYSPTTCAEIKFHGALIHVRVAPDALVDCAQVATTRTRKTVWTSLASGVQYNGYVE